MARLWRRQTYDTSCGRCGQEILKTQPALELSGEGWVKRRCAVCAGEPTPDLPPLQVSARVEIQPTRKPPRQDWRGMGEMAVDFKHKQAGDEPASKSHTLRAGFQTWHK